MPARPENEVYFERFLDAGWVPHWDVHPAVGDSPLECVIVEPRNHKYLARVLRNVSAHMPYASMTILHSLENAKHVEDVVGRYPNIRRIPFTQGNIDIYQYNALMCNPDFWRLFDKSQRVLLFQTDTGIRVNQVLQFMEYDYVGSPWTPHGDDPRVIVGNGGLSLRNPARMLDVTMRYPYRESGIVPEDMYFATHITEYDDIVLPTFEVAKSFSCEHHQHPDPMGFHQGYIWHEEEYVRDVLLNLDNCDMPYINCSHPVQLADAWIEDKRGKVWKDPSLLSWLRLGVGQNGFRMSEGTKVPVPDMSPGLPKTLHIMDQTGVVFSTPLHRGRTKRAMRIVV